MFQTRRQIVIFAFMLMAMPAQAQDATAPESSGDLIVQAEIPRGGDFMGFGFDSLWIMSGGRLVRVDPTDNSFIDIDIGNSFGRYRGVGIGEGAVWIPDVGTDVVYKVDPTANKVVNEIAAQMIDSEGSIGVGEGAIWVITVADRTLVRFNSDSGAVEAEIL